MLLNHYVLLYTPFRAFSRRRPQTSPWRSVFFRHPPTPQHAGLRFLDGFLFLTNLSLHRQEILEERMLECLLYLLHWGLWLLRSWRPFHHHVFRFSVAFKLGVKDIDFVGHPTTKVYGRVL